MLVGNAGVWTEIYRVDSSQVSWRKWVQVAAIPIGKFAGSQRQIRFRFESVAANTSQTLKGIGIGQILVRQPPSVTLQTTSYDENFSIPGNHAAGKATTSKEYDEATQQPIFARELHYVDPNGRVSDERLTFDWDRDGISQTTLDDYAYDGRGALASERFPYVKDGPYRRYYTHRTHGSVTGVHSVDVAGVQRYLIDNIVYSDAGSVSLVAFQNGTTQHFDANAAELPSRIWAEAGGGASVLFDTGAYSYDGARNIKQIGSDSYRYDAANRLTWSQVGSTTYGTVDLDQVYDAFGNMTAQNASYPSGSGPSLPNGLAFTGRTYLNNQITSVVAGKPFIYDASGNLTDEPAHDGLSAQSYAFTSDGRLSHVTDGAGKWYQSALYEGGDHRWFRSTWADGGPALITIRDASGDVIADFTEKNATSGLALDREYVRVNGQLMTINSTCGPRPSLALSDPPTVGGQVWFDKADFPAAPPVGSYTIYIRTDDGRSRTISEPSNLANHFSLAQSALFADITNWIQIETDASCGHTGYSNAVSYSYASAPQTGGCLQSMGGSRLDITDNGSNLKLVAVGACSAGTTYNVYYRDDADEFTQRLNGEQPTDNPSQVLSNLPCGSGSGQYWIVPVSPLTHEELVASPAIRLDGTSCSSSGIDAAGVAIGAPGKASMNAQYVHWDHLGSTRAMTDEHGIAIASFKYFPFGMEADTGGGDELRQKFTQHERDDRVGMDYMMARSDRPTLGRFLSPDGANAQIASDTQSWNLYAYVRNHPIEAFDPDGRREITMSWIAGIPWDSTWMVYKYNGGEKVRLSFTVETTRAKSPDSPVASDTKSAVGTTIRSSLFGEKRDVATPSATVTSGWLPDGRAMVTFHAEGQDPLPPLIPLAWEPAIWVDFSFIFSADGTSVEFRGSHSAFPQQTFTADAAGGGGPQTIYNFMPFMNATPLLLFWVNVPTTTKHLYYVPRATEKSDNWIQLIQAGPSWFH